MAGSDRCSAHLRIAHRKTSLTTEVADRLALMIRSGVPIGVACAAVNVSRASFHRWLNRDEPEFRAFQEQVGQARAQGEAALVLPIVRESATHWQTAAWLLEPRRPRRRGRLG